MERLNHLNVNITGTHKGDDGVEHVVDVTYEDMDFVYLTTFKEGIGQYTMDTGAVGRSCIEYWTNIVEDMMRKRVGLNTFMALIEIALKYMEADEKTGEG